MRAPVDRFSDFFKGVEGGGEFRQRSAEQERRHRQIIQEGGIEETQLSGELLARPASEVVSSLLKRIQPVFERDMISMLQAAWEEVAGPWASHCQPVQIQRHILHICVRGSTCLYEINLLHKKTILMSVQSHFPNLNITELRLKVG